MLFYHVNHGCKDFREGHVITLRPFEALDDAHAATWRQIAAAWNPKFPEGFSLWGLRLLYNHVEGDDVLDREYECEQFRQTFFPDRPSRFQCLFALETLDGAVLFRAQSKMRGTIWLVETDGPTFRRHAAPDLRQTLGRNISSILGGKTGPRLHADLGTAACPPNRDGSMCRPGRHNFRR